MLLYTAGVWLMTHRCGRCTTRLHQTAESIYATSQFSGVSLWRSLHNGCVLGGLGHTAFWDMLVHEGFIWCGPLNFGNECCFLLSYLKESSNWDRLVAPIVASSGYVCSPQRTQPPNRDVATENENTCKRDSCVYIQIGFKPVLWCLVKLYSIWTPSV